MRGHPDFDVVRDALRTRRADLPASYLVPEFLYRLGSTDTTLVDVGDPYIFFADLFDRILVNSQPVDRRRGLRRTDHIYQGFPRTFASLDRRIGTSLTQIAFLPFLRDRLDVSVFVCLPSGRIGRTHRKGMRGSPFAVSNPFDIDKSLGDPLLPDIPPIVQYRALIQACELLGIRAGSIVPMSTLAMDSPLFAAIPELGFWWCAEPGELVHCMATAQGLSRQPDLSSPAIDARAASRFVPPPEPAAVTTVETMVGTYHVVQGSSVGMTVTLANAFPDVLAGDASTYTWGDVAAIRYGPSTVPTPRGRPELAPATCQPAWDLMPALLAWRYHELGERVFMIDVSPSVPPALLRRARALSAAWHADLAEPLHRLGAGLLASGDAGRLLRELRECAMRGAQHPIEDITFIAEELWDFDLPDLEFDAVCGPLPYCVSAHTHNIAVLVSSLAHHLRVLQDRKVSSSFLAGVANHDTMPAVPWASALLRVVYQFLPGAVPLTFSGAEWGMNIITNKEFGFDSTPELMLFRERLGDDALALFNDVPIDWEVDAQEDHQIALIARLTAVARHLGDLRHWRYEVFAPDPELAPYCFGYIRSAGDHDARHLVVLANWSATGIEVKWTAPSARPILAVSYDGAPTLFCNGEVVKLPAQSAVVALAN